MRDLKLNRYHKASLTFSNAENGVMHDVGHILLTEAKAVSSYLLYTTASCVFATLLEEIPTAGEVTLFLIVVIIVK